MLQVCVRQTAACFWGDYKCAQMPVVFIRLFLFKTINVFAIYRLDALWPTQRARGWKWLNTAPVFTPTLECLEILENCLPLSLSFFAKSFVIRTWAEHDYTKPVPFPKVIAFLSTEELVFFDYLWYWLQQIPQSLVFADSTYVSIDLSYTCSNWPRAFCLGSRSSWAQLYCAITQFLVVTSSHPSSKDII